MSDEEKMIREKLTLALFESNARVFHQVRELAVSSDVTPDKSLVRGPGAGAPTTMKAKTLKRNGPASSSSGDL